MEPTTDAYGRGLVVLMPGPWADWVTLLDGDGYDGVVLSRADQVRAAVGGEFPPAGVNPSSGNPGGGNPSGGEPGRGKPASGNPGSGNPSGGNPASGNPGSGNPSGGNPGSGNPSGGNPGSGNPSSGDPGGGDPGGTGQVLRAGRRPVLLGHGGGGRTAYALNGRLALAAVIAVAPTRALSRPGLAGPRAPLLLVSGGRDRVASTRHVSALARRDRRRFPDAVTDHHDFPGRDHDLAFGDGWREVAGFCLDWLLRQGL